VIKIGHDRLLAYLHILSSSLRTINVSLDANLYIGVVGTTGSVVELTINTTFKKTNHPLDVVEWVGESHPGSIAIDNNL